MVMRCQLSWGSQLLSAKASVILIWLGVSQSTDVTHPCARAHARAAEWLSTAAAVVPPKIHSLVPCGAAGDTHLPTFCLKAPM